jgi:hypothetical protein
MSCYGGIVAKYRRIAKRLFGVGQGKTNRPMVPLADFMRCVQILLDHDPYIAGRGEIARDIHYR